MCTVHHCRVCHNCTVFLPLGLDAYYDVITNGHYHWCTISSLSAVFQILYFHWENNYQSFRTPFISLINSRWWYARKYLILELAFNLNLEMIKLFEGWCHFGDGAEGLRESCPWICLLDSGGSGKEKVWVRWNGELDEWIFAKKKHQSLLFVETGLICWITALRILLCNAATFWWFHSFIIYSLGCKPTSQNHL